jgi:hypothetical protein
MIETKELRSLQEAYLSIYEDKETVEEDYLTEEVEIATEYFYAEGLNEHGIDILIEELGIDEFAEFVYDIAEEYTLNEARRSGRIEPVTKAGKPIAALKGGAKTSAIAARRKEKAARDTSDDRPSGMTAALRSQATKAATKKQPETKSTPAQTKQGIGAKIGSALKTAGKVAKRAGEDIAITYKVAREVGKRAEKSAPVRKFWGMKEEIEAWVNQLIDEGYDLSEYTWDEMAEMYLDEAAGGGPRLTFMPKSRERNIGKHDDWKDKPLEWGERPEAAKKLKRRLNAVVSTQRRQDKETGVKENLDVYNFFLEYLLDEGFATDEESAQGIMVNMSEDWRQSIVNEATYKSSKSQQPADTRKLVTRVDKKGNTRAYQEYKAGNPNYRAAPGHGIDEE